MALGVRGNVGQFTHLSNDIDSTVTDWLKRGSGSGGRTWADLLWHPYVTFFPCGRWKRYKTDRIWNMISFLLTTDDAVTSRTVTRRWNIGNRYGALGDFYFMMLQSDQYEKQWHCESDV